MYLSGIISLFTVTVNFIFTLREPNVYKPHSFFLGFLTTFICFCVTVLFYLYLYFVVNQIKLQSYKVTKFFSGKKKSLKKIRFASLRIPTLTSVTPVQCSGIAEVRVGILASLNFSGFLFTTAKVVTSTVRIFFTFISSPHCSNIQSSYIHI